MKYKNYESDFVVRMTLPKGVDASDFLVEFSSGGLARYIASRIGGVFTNCAMNADGSINVVFDKHQLQPGQLRFKFILSVINSAMPDGVQRIVVPQLCDIMLTQGKGNELEQVDIDLIALANDYNLLQNKPQVNGVELLGDKTTKMLGIQCDITAVTVDGF
ncbi:MAG: hypothetical protein RSC87_09825 [Muribaculaceae bacterium]